MNVLKMFWSMLKGLFYRKNFEDKEEFWDWYWEQIPDSRYPKETLFECWDTFKYTITFEELRFNLRMWYLKHFGKHYDGYSWTFKQNGYFIRDWRSGLWWFVPASKEFNYGSVNSGLEIKNNNPAFALL